MYESSKLLAIISLSLTLTLTSDEMPAAEQPIQHLEVATITDYDEAIDVFGQTTAALKAKTELNTRSLDEIHIITYSLEQAVAYFVAHFNGQQQATAQRMAAVVELVHLASENNRSVETQMYLDEYFDLADKLNQSICATNGC